MGNHTLQKLRQLFPTPSLTCQEVHVCLSLGSSQVKTPIWAQLACPKVTQETAPLEKPSVPSRGALSLGPADALKADMGLPAGLITQMGSWQGESSLG